MLNFKLALEKNPEIKESLFIFYKVCSLNKIEYKQQKYKLKSI
jgi:hypothetical protein